MIRTPFMARAGSAQGRIQPSGFTAPEGSFVFALGAPSKRRFEVGDYIEVRQDLGIVAAKRLLARLRLEPNPEAIAGYTWRLTFSSSTVRTLEYVVDRPADLSDVSLFWNGLGFASFRLTLEGPPGDRPFTASPMVYVDAVQFDTGDSLRLTNRFPEPGHVGVPRDTSVAVEITTTTADTISLPNTQLYVNGVLAFAGGVVQAGFSGSHSFPDMTQRTIRIVVTPDDLFESEQVVSVRAVSRLTTAGTAIDETYAFTCEDQTPAGFESILARDERTIRVTWNEDVLQVSPTGANDALNPANWTLTATAGFPAVPLSVASVRTVSGPVVDLVTNIPMTPRATYEVSASAIADAFGNSDDGTYGEPGYWGDDDEAEEDWG
ncbi:MAG: hypothetical protein HOV80_17585 [Polyangiaceae bacterium]|nr:hypothetical protein [Polyangiaceae bacterium]